MKRLALSVALFLMSAAALFAAKADKAKIVKVDNVKMAHTEAKVLTGQNLNISFAKG